MQIKISPVNYEKCYPRRLKKFFETHINLNYNKFVPYMERAVVGNIPVEIIKIFPKETRGNGIKNFQNALSKTAIALRKSYDEQRLKDDFSFLDCNFRPSKYIKEIAKTGEETLNQELLKIFGENFMEAKLDYAGFGSFKNVFKLSLLDINGKKILHDKAFQVYSKIRESDPRFSKLHNTYAEANFWTFLKRAAGHRLDNTQFTKHYISDLNSGYCITEYIDEKIPGTTKPLDIYKLFNFLVPTDKQYNIKIMGKEYDAGGYAINKEFTSNKILIRYTKQLYYSLGKQFDDVVLKLKSLIENPKTPYRKDLEKILNKYISSKQSTSKVHKY